MIVKHIKKREKMSDPNIKLGDEYFVVEFSISSKHVYIRVVNDNGEPILYPLELFEVVDNKIPTNWLIDTNTVEGMNTFNLIPFNFRLTKNYFFDDYFDSTPEREKECKEILEKELEAIKKFHGR